jgi:hypothetical protein
MAKGRQMANLHQELMRASSVARLEKLMSDLDASGTSYVWDAQQKRFFLSLLLPFSDQMSASSVRLSSGTETVLVDGMDVLNALVAEESEKGDEAVIKELEGLSQLYSRLSVEGRNLSDDDVRRAQRLAMLVRRILLCELPTAPAQVAFPSRETVSPVL